METALSIVAIAQRDLGRCAGAQARSLEGTSRTIQTAKIRSSTPGLHNH